jgi:hypothetical protein
MVQAVSEKREEVAHGLQRLGRNLLPAIDPGGERLGRGGHFQHALMFPAEDGDSGIHDNKA